MNALLYKQHRAGVARFRAVVRDPCGAVVGFLSEPSNNDLLHHILNSARIRYRKMSEEPRLSGADALYRQSYVFITKALR